MEANNREVRPGRSDFINDIVRPPSQAADNVAQDGRKKKLWLTGLAALLIVAVGAGAGIYLHGRLASPVPARISRSVDFSVYYPDPVKLPPGYQLDKNSFSSPVKNGVAYWLTYGNGKKVVFSVQPKPSDNELQTFNRSYIPLRVDYQTPVGQAEIGAYHLQTLVSLPVANGPWVIITAPSDIDQGQLKAVLRSIKH